MRAFICLAILRKYFSDAVSLSQFPKGRHSFFSTPILHYNRSFLIFQSSDIMRETDWKSPETTFFQETI